MSPKQNILGWQASFSFCWYRLPLFSVPYTSPFWLRSVVGNPSFIAHHNALHKSLPLTSKWARSIWQTSTLTFLFSGWADVEPTLLRFFIMKGGFGWWYVHFQHWFQLSYWLVPHWSDNLLFKEFANSYNVATPETSRVTSLTLFHVLFRTRHIRL